MKKLILILLLCSVFTSCFFIKNNLRIGIVKNTLSAIPFDSPKTNKFLQANHLTLRYFTSYNELNSALIKGKIDLAFLPFNYSITDFYNGKDVRIVSNYYRNSDLIACIRDLTGIDDLRYKEVGVVPASAQETLVKMLSEKAQLNLKLAYASDFASLNTMLTSGKTLAVATSIPWNTSLNENYRTLLNFSDYLGDYPACDIVTTVTKSMQKREQIKAFLVSFRLFCQDRQAYYPKPDSYENQKKIKALNTISLNPKFSKNDLSFYKESAKFLVPNSEKKNLNKLLQKIY